jgi:hypothetical protein
MQAKSNLVVLLAITLSAACQTRVPAKSPAAAVADTANYDGFVIKTKRSIKAGDAIPVLVVGGTPVGAMSVLSVAAAEGVTDPSKAEPWFAAFPETTTMHDRAAVEHSDGERRGNVEAHRAPFHRNATTNAKDRARHWWAEANGTILLAAATSVSWSKRLHRRS